MTRPSRFHCLRCVINKLTTDELWISPVYRNDLYCVEWGVKLYSNSNLYTDD